jgi:hypothetical protein
MVKKLLVLLLMVSLFIVVGCNQNSFEDQREISQIEDLDDRELERALNEEGQVEESLAGQAFKTKKLSVGCVESETELVLSKGKYRREIDRFFCSSGNSLLRVCTESGFTSHLNERCKYGCIDGACVDPYKKQGESDLVTEDKVEAKNKLSVEKEILIDIKEIKPVEPAISDELDCNDVISVGKIFDIGDERFTYVSSSSSLEDEPSALIRSSSIGKNINYNIITSSCTKEGFCISEFTIRWEGKNYKFVSKLTNVADFDAVYTCSEAEDKQTSFY